MNGDDVQAKETLELGDYLRVLKERFWVIPVTIAVVLGVTLAVSLTSTPQYRAFSRLQYVGDKLQQAVSGVQVSSESDEGREVRTAAVLVKLEPLAEMVAEELGTSRSTSSLLKMVSVQPREETNFVDIYAVGPNAVESAQVANAFAEEFVRSREEADKATVKAARDVVDNRIRTLSREELATDYGLSLQEKSDNLRMLESMQTGGFEVKQPATKPGGPFAPTPARSGILALVVSLVGGIGLAFLLDYLDRRVKDDKAVEKLLGAPVLASVPLVGGPRRRSRNGDRLKEPVGFNNRPALLEAFRTLRSNMEFFGLDKRQSIWLITSSVPQEGKTTTTINLALSIALSGKRVVVLEADLRRPMVHEYFGVEQTPGLSNVLAGTKRLEDAMQFVKADEFMPPESRRRPGEESPGLMQRNLYTIASGPVPPNPAELLSSPRMAKLIKDLASMTDCLLIDSPPVLPVADALTVARHTDGVIVVVRLGATTRDQLRETRAAFELAGLRVIGAVTVAAKKSPAYRRKRGYGYGYGYGYEAAPSDSSVD